MGQALNAYSRKDRAAAVTVSPQNDAASEPKKAAGAPADVDQIHDFYLSAGDKIDLRPVAAHFGLSADDAHAALTFAELPCGTELGIEVNGAIHRIAVIHGVFPIALWQAAPWILDDGAAATIRETRDGVLPSVGGTATDAFVFQASHPSPTSPIIDHFKLNPNVTQVALALGISEAQVMEAIRDAHLLADHDTTDQNAATATQDGTDALIG